MSLSNTRRWASRELVLIGVFAAAAKLSSLLIALAGGGMNPVSLIAKNLVFTTLLIVLLTKVPKPWTLMLFTVISMLVSISLIGGSLVFLPAALAGALVGELLIMASGGYGTRWAPWIGAAAFDFVMKAISIGMAYVFMRETPALMSVALPIVTVGYVGSLAGLWFGWKTVGELKHAGLVR